MKDRAGGSPVDLERLLPERTLRRRLFQRALARGERPIVVASMSRAGSTTLFWGVAKSWTKLRFGRFAPGLLPCMADAAWRLDEMPLIGGVVYKTHDLPENLSRAAGARVLFTYRKASDVALSLAHCRTDLGDAWFRSARQRLRGRGGYEQFLRADTLGLERQVDLWSNAEGVDVLGLRYETLWDHTQDIEDFLGFPVRLRRRRASRRPEPSGDLADLLRDTYGELDRKIEKMPDMFVRRSALG